MSTTAASFQAILKETFSAIEAGADGTWFVQGNEGFYDAIDGLSAEEASVQLAPDVSSIAAHTDHTRYYLWTTNAYLRGESVVDDWPGSWKNQTVDEAQWQEIKAGLRHEVNTLLGSADKLFEEGKPCIGAFANVAHAAFHLGAVRQLLRLVKGR
jgi:hypothetical protein